jgi:hypothetical protein
MNPLEAVTDSYAPGFFRRCLGPVFMPGVPSGASGFFVFSICPNCKRLGEI